MNLETLSADFHNLSSSGRTLNVEERAALHSSLTLLKSEHGFSRVIFWGKLMGSTADYLIAQGFNPQAPVAAQPVLHNYFDDASQFPTRTFRLGPDRVSWIPVPPVDEAIAEKYSAWQYVSRKKGVSFVPLTGNPAHKYQYIVECLMPTPPEPEPSEEPKPEGGEEGEAEEGEGEEGEPKPTKPKGPIYEKEERSITEEERLSALISEIDRDCAVVPRAAFVLNSSRQVVQNQLFLGLDPEAAIALQNYYHLRRATTLASKKALERSELDKSIEFLDPLSEDKPKGCWAIKPEVSSSHVALQSLLWPGYHFYHTVGTPAYAGCYFGFGDRNYDLAFML